MEIQGFLQAGCKFDPLDHEVINMYLRPRVMGLLEAYPHGFILEGYDVCEGAPWNLPRHVFRFGQKGNQAFFFTKRHPLGGGGGKKKNVKRTAGEWGTWHGNGQGIPIFDPADKSTPIGHKISLPFLPFSPSTDDDGSKKKKKRCRTPQSNPLFDGWMMHEYILHSDEFQELAVAVVFQKNTAASGGLRGLMQPSSSSSSSIPAAAPLQQFTDDDDDHQYCCISGTTCIQPPPPKRQRPVLNPSPGQAQLDHHHYTASTMPLGHVNPYTMMITCDDDDDFLNLIDPPVPAAPLHVEEEEGYFEIQSTAADMEEGADRSYGGSAPTSALGPPTAPSESAPPDDGMSIIIPEPELSFDHDDDDVDYLELLSFDHHDDDVDYLEFINLSDFDTRMLNLEKEAKSPAAAPTVLTPAAPLQHLEEDLEKGYFQIQSAAPDMEEGADRSYGGSDDRSTARVIDLI